MPRPPKTRQHPPRRATVVCYDHEQRVLCFLVPSTGEPASAPTSFEIPDSDMQAEALIQPVIDRFLASDPPPPIALLARIGGFCYLPAHEAMFLVPGSHLDIEHDTV